MDWYNVMTYDFFGAFDADGLTAPHSPLTNYTGKMRYKRSQGLEGAFFWELSGDTGNGSLINAIYSNP